MPVIQIMYCRLPALGRSYMDKEYEFHCRGCSKPDEEYPSKKNEYGEQIIICQPIQYHRWARNDAYGIYTGLYCDKCYKDNYPYRRDRYHDESYAGERLEIDE